jgi:hypothetical protein
MFKVAFLFKIGNVALRSLTFTSARQIGWPSFADAVDVDPSDPLSYRPSETLKPKSSYTESLCNVT